MSHVTRLTGVVITSVSAMQAAVAELQRQGISITLKQNCKPRVHGYDSVATCDYVLGLPGAYDLGLKKNERGQYEPVLDVYQGHVGRYLGATCPVPGTAQYASQEYTQHQIGRFLQEYQRFSAVEQAQSEGYIVESCDKDKEGNYQLILGVLAA